MGKKTINQKEDITDNKFTVLGTFTGECADAMVTNENGLDIPREVWETVFASELYQQGIDLRWYIGFLGHPEDPGCMDFEHACIVMTEGHIDQDGKVYGTFDLIDTPVGRIVKTFIDAGTTFGISVRGAGDIINNSVDPETFVFRGFDLVTFPAYREAIPEFKAIAASTNEEDRKKYKKVCAAVEENLPNITSAEAIEVIQDQLPEQSETYKHLEDRKHEILEDIQAPEVTEKTIHEEKLYGMTSLYLEEKARADKAEADLRQTTKILEATKASMNKKLHTVARITAAQEHDLNELQDKVIAENAKLKNENKIAISAAQRVKEQLHDEKENNLRYVRKIEASEKVLAEKDKNLRKLQKELNETVVAATDAKKQASDFDSVVEDLKQQITCSQNLVAEYQDAYANLYARAIGVDLNVSVTASTTVDELQKKIAGSSHVKTGINSSTAVEPEQVDFDDNFDNDLVTL